MGAEELKPIKWRVWGGKVERESGGGGPFQGLEERLGFVDIRVSHLWHAEEYFRSCGHYRPVTRWLYEMLILCVTQQAKRKEFADWIRNQGADNKKI